MTNGNMAFDMNQNSSGTQLLNGIGKQWADVWRKNDISDRLKDVAAIRRQAEELKLDGWEQLVIALLEYEVMIRKRLQKASALRAP